MLPLLARLLLICGLVVPGAARAVDGVVEISQASVAAGGGFPLLISAEGSYVLTSNLVVTDPNLDAIQISSDYVTLDLNGFHISGPVTCSGPPGSISCSMSRIVSWAKTLSSLSPCSSSNGLVSPST